MSTIDMQTMRYINLLDRTSRVKTTKCFVYNNTIIFAVPRMFMSKAIGPDASNVKNMQQVLGKKIRIIEDSEDISKIDKFVSDVVSPVKFKSIEVKEGALVLTAGNTQSKASLIGRDKRRFEELFQILKDSFGMELKIV